MNNNLITDVPKEIYNLVNLERLILDKNNINSLPIELSKCNNLKMLYLSQNPINLDTDKIVLMLFDKLHNRVNNIIKEDIHNDIIGECNICMNNNIKILQLGCFPSHVICSNCILLLKCKKCPYCIQPIMFDKITYSIC